MLAGTDIGMAAWGVCKTAEARTEFARSYLASAGAPCSDSDVVDLLFDAKICLLVCKHCTSFVRELQNNILPG